MSDIGETGSGESSETTSAYDTTTVAGQVRFWLSDTGANDCWMFTDAEIANLLRYAHYPGSATDNWTSASDVQISLALTPQCPYSVRDTWGWLSWWDGIYTPLYVSFGIRLYIFGAAALGWEALSNDAALLAKITRTGLFGTDTWTTSKAVASRVLAMRQMAQRETPSMVSQARMPCPFHVGLPRW